MKKEYDFSKGERGKFYRPDAQLNLPIYLELSFFYLFSKTEVITLVVLGVYKCSMLAP
jgi:hypothetical protein